MNGKLFATAVLGLVAVVACSKAQNDSTPASTIEAPARVETLPADDRAPRLAQLPPWFGDPDAPPRRLAGVLRGPDGPIAGSVHLGIGALDWTWLGLDRTVAPDGHFDFGELRPGKYTLFGRAPGLITRVLSVDTRVQADSVVLFAWPCTMEFGYVVHGKTRLAGAHLSIAGVEVGVTNDHGRFSLCIIQEEIKVLAQAPGYADGVGLMWEEDPSDRRDGVVLALIEVDKTVTVRGTVVNVMDAPIAGAVVSATDSSMATTTDASGQFELNNVPEGHLDEVPSDDPPGSETPRWDFTVRSGDNEYRIWVDHEIDTSTPVKLKVSSHNLVVTSPEVIRSRTNPGITLTGRVIDRGKPLADASLFEWRTFKDPEAAELEGPVMRARTLLDGSFELAGPSVSRGLVLLQLHHPTCGTRLFEVDVVPEGAHGLTLEIKRVHHVLM